MAISSQIGWEQNEISIECELWWKNRSWNGPQSWFPFIAVTSHGRHDAQITSKLNIYLIIFCDTQLRKSLSSILFYLLGGFPSQRASDAESAFMLWRHHVKTHYGCFRLPQPVGFMLELAVDRSVLNHYLTEPMCMEIVTLGFDRSAWYSIYNAIPYISRYIFKIRIIDTPSFTERAKYEVCFVGSESGQFDLHGCVVVCEISCYIRSGYNDTRRYDARIFSKVFLVAPSHNLNQCLFVLLTEPFRMHFSLIVFII